MIAFIAVRLWLPWPMGRSCWGTTRIPRLVLVSASGTPGSLTATLTGTYPDAGDRAVKFTRDGETICQAVTEVDGTASCTDDTPPIRDCTARRAEGKRAPCQVVGNGCVPIW